MSFNGRSEDVWQQKMLWYIILCLFSDKSSSLIMKFSYVQKEYRAMKKFPCDLLNYDLRIFKVNMVYSQVLESLTLTKKACLVKLQGYIIE